MSSITAWGQMIARCYDPKHHKYARYGGRGIRVCDRWICRRLFLEDMGPRPPGMTLNRIDNDGDYCPENCEWATAETQAQNRSDNHNLTLNGETRCLEDWSRVTGIGRSTLRRRLKSGWSVEKTLSTPVLKSRKPEDETNDYRYL